MRYPISLMSIPPHHTETLPMQTIEPEYGLVVRIPAFHVGGPGSKHCSSKHSKNYTDGLLD